MAERLVVDSNVVNDALTSVTAAISVSDTIRALIPDFGSPQVAQAWSTNVSLRAQRQQALEDLVATSNSSVRDSVTQMLAADHAAALQLEAR